MTDAAYISRARFWSYRKKKKEKEKKFSHRFAQNFTWIAFGLFYVYCCLSCNRFVTYDCLNLWILLGLGKSPLRNWYTKSWHLMFMKHFLPAASNCLRIVGVWMVFFFENMFVYSCNMYESCTGRIKPA